MISKIIFIILFISLIVDAREPMYYGIIDINSDIELLDFWSSNGVYNKLSIETISRYTKLSDQQYQQAYKELLKVIFAFESTVKFIQLPKEYLLLIRRYAISLQNHKKTKKRRIKSFLVNIIWWSEARLIDNKAELVKFLTNQIKTKKRRKFSFSIFIERGFVDELTQLSQIVSFKNSESLFALAIRQAKIRQLFLSGKPIQKERLINEVEWSISTIVLSKNKNRRVYNYDYINWLIMQFGIYRDRPVVSGVLNDMLLISKTKSNYDNLNPTNLEYKKLSNLIQENKYSFSIKHEIEQALSPFTPIEFKGDI